MNREKQIEQIRTEFSDIKEVLNEQSLRWWCASKARAYNRVHPKGGISIISEATGISRARIRRGIKEIESKSTIDITQVRNKGGGRKKNH